MPTDANNDTTGSTDSNSTDNHDSTDDDFIYPVPDRTTIPDDVGMTEHRVTFEAVGIELYPEAEAYDYAQIEVAIRTAIVELLEEELAYFPDDANVTAECMEGIGISRGTTN